MMFIKSYLLALLIFMVLLIACNNNRDTKKKNSKTNTEYIFEDLNRYYLDLKTRVNTKLTQHFPEFLDTNNIDVLGTPAGSGNLFKLVVTNRITNLDVKKKYSKICIAKYSGDEPCILTYRKILSMKKYISTKLRSCYINKYPIPDFRRSNFRDISTESGLPSDFDIYVLESEPKIHIPDSEIINRKILLKKWEEGFSRGVAISEKKKIIIYWVIVW